MAIDYRKYWNEAFPWTDYLEREVKEHPALWNGVWNRARVHLEFARRRAFCRGGCQGRSYGGGVAVRIRHEFGRGRGGVGGSGTAAPPGFG